MKRTGGNLGQDNRVVFKNDQVTVRGDVQMDPVILPLDQSPGTRIKKFRMDGSPIQVEIQVRNLGTNG